jgi:FixJ family two-component response regulator
MRMCMKRLLSKHGYNVALFDSGVALLSRGDFSDALCVIIVNRPGIAGGSNS